MVGDHVIDSLFDIEGNLLSVRAYTPDGTEIPVPDPSLIPEGINPLLLERVGGEDSGNVSPMGSGGGGSPSPSGCRMVTVNNEKESTLGFTLFWFHTSTEWCWTSSSYYISWAITDWWFSDVDPVWSFQSITRNHTGYYQYVSGYSNSGHFNDKQAHFQSCVWVVCQNQYPRNQLWAFYNGAYQWVTED